MKRINEFHKQIKITRTEDVLGCITLCAEYKGKCLEISIAPWDDVREDNMRAKLKAELQKLAA